MFMECILGMHPCMYEKTSYWQLSGHLKEFLFLGFDNSLINMFLAIFSL